MKTNFKIGDSVVKKSGKPFKNGTTHQTIVEFGINEQDPNKRPCAIFSDGSVCNLDMLNKTVYFDIETDGLGNFDMNFINSRTIYDKIDDTVFPVNYYENGIVTIDYPTKL